MSYKDLETAFSEYVEFAARNLKPQDRGSETLRVIRNPLIELNEIIERLEKSDEFKGIAQETQREFPLGVWIVNGWEHELRNFFRRSGFYQERFSDKPFDLPALFELYLSSLKREKVQLRFIAPIATIDFGLPELELPEFAIRKFGMSELDNIFENDMRRIFYPTTVVDSKALADYWCIDTTMQMPRERGIDTWHEDLSPSFLKEISVFPDL